MAETEQRIFDDREILNHLVRENIKSRLKSTGLTYDDIGAATHLTAEELRDLEHGTGAIGSDVLYMLSDYFRCDPNDFYLGVFDFKAPTRQAGNQNRDNLLTKSLVKKFNPIPDSDLKLAVFNMVAGLSELSRYLNNEGYELRRIPSKLEEL